MPSAFQALFFLLGLVFGSFGTVLVERLPAGQSIGGRSRCAHCKKKLRFWELIPAASYLFLIGRCRHCQSPIGWQSLFLELGSAGLFLFALLLHSSSPVGALILALIFWLLLLVTVIDAQTKTIPDLLDIPLFLLCLLHAFLFGPLTVSGLLLGGAFFGAQWALSRGRWVGSGDVFLAVALGIFLGTWQRMLLCLIIAYIVGALIVSILLTAGKVKRGSLIAFGPFLILGALLVFLFGDALALAFL